MKNDIAFVGTFIGDFIEIELIVAGIDESFDRQIIFGEISIFGYLRSEDDLGC